MNAEGSGATRGCVRALSRRARLRAGLGSAPACVRTGLVVVLLLPAALGLGSAGRAHPPVLAGKQAAPSDAGGKEPLEGKTSSCCGLRRTECPKTR